MEKKKINVITVMLILLLAIFAAGMVKNVATPHSVETVNTAAEK